MEKIIVDLKIKRRNSEADIRERIENLNEFRRQINKDIDNTLTALENASVLNKKLEAALETANEQIAHYDEVIVPALSAGNQVLLDRWMAESAVLAMRTGAAQAKEADV